MKLFIYSFATIMALSGAAQAQLKGAVREKGAAKIEAKREESLKEKFGKALKESKASKAGEIDLAEVDTDFRNHKVDAEKFLTRIQNAKTSVEADTALVVMGLTQELLKQSDKKAATGGTQKAQSKVKLPDLVETFKEKAELSLGNASGEALQLAILEIMVDAKTAVRSGKSLSDAMVESITEYRKRKDLGEFKGDLKKTVEDCFGI